MATTIKMPQLGESVTEGTIERWLVKEGDTVEQYDPLFEVVTDKVNAEVPAEIAGTITKIMVPDGETVAVGTPLAEIDAEGGAAAAEAPAAEPVAAAAPAVEETPAEAPAPPEATADAGTAAVEEQEQAPAAAEAAPAPEPPATARARRTGAGAGRRGPGAASTPETPSERWQRRRGRMTPAVRRLVREHDIDVAQLSGSGAGGRVTRDDVLAFIDKAPAAQATDAPAQAPAAAAAGRRRSGAGRRSRGSRARSAPGAAIGPVTVRRRR